MLKLLRKYLDRTKIIREVGSFDEEGLICAVEEGNFVCLEILLEAGINVNAQSERGVPAVSRAIDKDQLPCLRMLVDAEANIDQKSKTGNTPLMHAIDHGNKHIFAYLMDQEPELEIPDLKGETALFRAIRAGNTTFARKLIEAGAECEHRNRNGLTPLMLAADQERIGIVKALLGAGVDPNVKDRNGHSVMDRQHLSPRIQKMLKKAARAFQNESSTPAMESLPPPKNTLPSQLFRPFPQLSAVAIGLFDGIIQALNAQDTLGELEERGRELIEQMDARPQNGSNGTPSSSQHNSSLQKRLNQIVRFLIEVNKLSQKTFSSSTAKLASPPPSSVSETKDPDSPLSKSETSSQDVLSSQELNLALIEAVLLGSPTLALICLRQGADPNSTTPKGRPVIQLALHNQEILELLLAAGADPQSVEEEEEEEDDSSSANDEGDAQSELEEATETIQTDI